MKKLFTTATYATIFSLLAVSAMAKNYSNNDGFYVGLSGDIAFKKNSKANVNGTSNQIDYGFNSGANVALGYNATSNIRLEAEGGYHAFGIKKTTVGNSSTSRSTDLKITTIMGNAFYDFNNSSSFSPYIGAGAGVAFVNLPTYILNTDKSVDNKFAYQLMAGVAYTRLRFPQLIGMRDIAISMLRRQDL